MATGPVVEKISRRNGVAGQVEISALVRYPDEQPNLVTFVGSVYGGPVVMITPEGRQLFVSAPGRFGTFGEGWVRRFFA